MLSLPTIPIWLALAAALPQDWPATLNYFMITVILSLTGWAQLARVVRGRFLQSAHRGFRHRRAPRRRVRGPHHLPPHAAELRQPHHRLGHAGDPGDDPGRDLAARFLGLGLQPPTISWGVLLREAQNIRSIATAPWLFAPGAAVVLAVLALNFLGDGLRDAADPYNK